MTNSCIPVPLAIRPLERDRSAGVFALAILACALVAPAASAQLSVYTDSLQNGFTDWSWGTRNLAQTAVVHSGTAAISFEPDAWAGLFLHRDAGFTGTEYEAIELWVRGSGAGGQQLTVAILTGGSPTGSAPLAGFVEGGSIPAGSWAKATVPFSALGLTTGSWDGLWLQDSSGGNQATIYVDDVRLLARTGPPPPPPVGGAVTVAVDPALDRRLVNPQIFGVNFGSTAQAAALKWPVRRWGGNSVTRYNWQNDTSNKGMDWFFMNVPEDNPAPENLPSGSAADRFLAETRATGGEPILTVPLIGWTPKSRAKSWGFSVQSYGAQTETECTATGGVFWCQPDAGNGIRAGGAFVTGNNPLDTSIAIGPSFVTAWMDHLITQFGTAGSGGIRYYALDNEPALWDSTHRDVHPQPLTFDELWTKSRDVAAAIKAKDPAAVVFGPVSWGWCEYFYSAADNCSPNGADFIAHGSVPLTQWYLRQVRQYQEAHGVRLVDVLDVHYYPQADGVALSGDESAATSARRLRSLRSLWDPTYVDESWIPAAVRLIPRMKEWIAAELPGTKLAITEYSWGNDDGLSSALAQAEVLGIFAREGVDIATRWVAPAAGSFVEDAFRLWLDYDGAGSRVAGASVRAASTVPDAVSGYAVEAPGGALRVVLVNRDTVQRPVTVAVVGGGTRSARLFGFDGATRLAALGTATFGGGSLALDLPPRSARLLEVAPESVAPSPSSFHTLTPCRLVDTRNATGPFGGPALTAGETRSFTVADGACGVPADAKAVAVNVTVTGQTAAGALTLFPGSGVAPVTTTISFAAGKTRANNALIGLTGGVLSIADRQETG
ncbi:MAG TPA: glycoside hydrolase family 44 protein, partial [Thermoanaerobaculia bacterium]|nr:glycoside hydrolase family 44 protein [Thermoanaerobaculia bacterium]